MSKLKARLQKLLVDYGPVAVVVYFAIFFFTLGGFALALSHGFHTNSTAGKAGILGAAYLATQGVKPLRFLATFALTPLVAQTWRRIRGKPANHGA